MVGAIIGAAANAGSMFLNHQWQTDAADLNWSRQLEFWRMQNEYNTPAKQMERYRAAGLNPNLIYGSGSASAGNASGSPTPQMPASQNYRFDSLANIDSWLIQKEQAKADIKNKDSLSRYNDVKAQSEYISMLGKEIANANAQEDYDRAIRLRDLRDQIELDTAELLKHNIDKTAAAAQVLENQNEFYELTLNTNLKRAVLDVQNAVKDGQIKDATKAKINADILAINKRIALMQYELDSNPDAASTKEYREELQNIELSIRRLDEENAQLFKTSNAWADAISRWTGVIGSALGGNKK